MAEVGAERRVFKPDFGGNFYRFLVSTGLALIGLAFTLPWVLFRQSNVLMTTRAEVAGLTPDGKQAVTRIQREQLFWLDNYWYAFWPLVSVGSVAVIWGFIAWHKRQTATNMKEDLDTEIVRMNLHQLSPAESEADLENKAEAFIAEADAPGKDSPVQVSELTETRPLDETRNVVHGHVFLDTSSRILGIEYRATELIRHAFEDNYMLQSGTSGELAKIQAFDTTLDALLIPSNHSVHRIFGFRMKVYARPSVSRLQADWNSLTNLDLNKIPATLTLVLFIICSQEVSTAEYETYRAAAKRWWKKKINEHKLKGGVYICHEGNMASISPNQFAAVVSARTLGSWYGPTGSSGEALDTHSLSDQP